MRSTSIEITEMDGRIVGERYLILDRIGRGSFGTVHCAVDIATFKKVAIKMETESGRHPTLYRECRLYSTLQQGESAPWFSRTLWYGQELGYNLMAMTLLGPNLKQLLQECGGRFSLKTTLLIVDSAMGAMEYLHRNGFIHRDVKPENFVIGTRQNCNQVYLVDFGLSKRYLDDTGKHIQWKRGIGSVGTAHYSSYNAQRGNQLSRRDDMEALGNMFMYFLRGSLPWQEILKTKGASKEEIAKVYLEGKTLFKVDDLCMDYPVEFGAYLKYCKYLQFTEEPHYLCLREMFRVMAEDLGYEYDLQFDWTHEPDRIDRNRAAVQQLHHKPELQINTSQSDGVQEEKEEERGRVCTLWSLFNWIMSFWKYLTNSTSTQSELAIF